MREQSGMKAVARRALAGLLGASSWLVAAEAGALSIALAPGVATPPPGGSFALDVTIGDLGTDVIGAFDLTVAFDASAVSVATVGFDAALGAIPAEATAEFVVGPSSVALAGFSILPTSALAALQGDSFRLATIVFDVLDVAPSTIAITSALLGDGAGAPLQLTAPPGGTSVRPIPEPAVAQAFAIGLALLAGATRRRAAGRARRAPPCPPSGR